VWTYRILVANHSAPLWKLFSSKSLGHHFHLYTQNVAGQETDEIERWLDREFETPAEGPIRKVLSNAQLTPNDWKCLVRFLAAQDVRTPAWFAQKMKSWEQSLPELLKRVMEESLEKYERSSASGEPLSQPPLTENRERLPLRVRVRRDPSSGGEIGTEMHGMTSKARTGTAAKGHDPANEKGSSLPRNRCVKAIRIGLANNPFRIPLSFSFYPALALRSLK
jgi:hypothetical protein